MISLLTHGWICYATRTIINKYILPYNLQIKDKTCIDLDIMNKNYLILNLDNITDKQINLKLTDSQVNIKRNLDNQINIEE